MRVTGFLYIIFFTFLYFVSLRCYNGHVPQGVEGTEHVAITNSPTKIKLIYTPYGISNHVELRPGSSQYSPQVSLPELALFSHVEADRDVIQNRFLDCNQLS